MIQKQKPKVEIINSYIYPEITTKTPTRYQMVRYSTWRIYAYNQLESAIQDFRSNQQKGSGYWKADLFRKLEISNQKKQFFDFLYQPTIYKQDFEAQMREDNISHFICRMLYCQQDNTKYKFISMEKRILENRLKIQLLNFDKQADNFSYNRGEFMKMLKRILAFFKGRNMQEYNIPQEQWNIFSDSISFHVKSYSLKKYKPILQQFCKLSLEQGDIGLRKRRSFMSKGYVYVSCETMIDIIVTSYDIYLTDKLEKTKPIVNQLIAEDMDNQFSVFLLQTIKQIYQETMQDTKLQDNNRLTLRNVDFVANKLFPPCMLNLNQHLKNNRHLRHDGRRQLWGFFKACGMDVHDNKQYFRRNLQGKATAQDMKGHMYNIQHAYGLKGNKKSQNGWACRGIIENAAPKKGEHHGCPFAHWRSQQLSDYLRKNYKVSENKLEQIMKIKEQKHFQIACGRLFEYSDINSYEANVPGEITAKLGRSPHMYFEAGMQLRNLKQQRQQPSRQQQQPIQSRQQHTQSKSMIKQESKVADTDF